jgi:ABC-type proline/glycine betaine transport system permease subunit
MESLTYGCLNTTFDLQVLLVLVGAGGIGMELNKAMEMASGFQKVTAILICILIIVVILDLIGTGHPSDGLLKKSTPNQFQTNCLKNSTQKS